MPALTLGSATASGRVAMRGCCLLCSAYTAAGSGRYLPGHNTIEQHHRTAVVAVIPEYIAVVVGASVTGWCTCVSDGAKHACATPLIAFVLQALLLYSIVNTAITVSPPHLQKKLKCQGQK